MLPTREAFVYLLYIVSLKQPIQNISKLKNGKTEHGHYPHIQTLSSATTYEENRLAPWRMFYDTACCQGKITLQALSHFIYLFDHWLALRPKRLSWYESSPNSQLWVMFSHILICIIQYRDRVIFHHLSHPCKILGKPTKNIFIDPHMIDVKHWDELILANFVWL